MPLIKSGSKAAVGKNIKTEMAAGKPQKQAVAIAMNTKDKAKMPDRGQRTAKHNDTKHPGSHDEWEKLGS
ncbi:MULTISPECIES: hypothetical protein [Paraburkholderia]|uniref:hypothetical protein n=1 Tax=Paraburkholderia TaxID=1822464 RepID=UPI0038B80FD8